MERKPPVRIVTLAAAPRGRMAPDSISSRHSMLSRSFPSAMVPMSRLELLDSLLSSRGHLCDLSSLRLALFPCGGGSGEAATEAAPISDNGHRPPTDIAPSSSSLPSGILRRQTERRLEAVATVAQHFRVQHPQLGTILSTVCTMFTDAIRELLLELDTAPSQTAMIALAASVDERKASDRKLALLQRQVDSLMSELNAVKCECNGLREAGTTMSERWAEARTALVSATEELKRRDAILRTIEIAQATDHIVASAAPAPTTSADFRRVFKGKSLNETALHVLCDKYATQIRAMRETIARLQNQVMRLEAEVETKKAS